MVYIMDLLVNVDREVIYVISKMAQIFAGKKHHLNLYSLHNLWFALYF